MNDPKDQPIDIEGQRLWLAEHKQTTGLSWKQLSGRIGIPHQSLGLFVNKNYNAPTDRFAEAIFRYRQTLAAQTALRGEMPSIPGYFETPTTNKLITTLNWAQQGRMTAAALSPGLGKTMAARHYQACNANVFVMTPAPSTGKLVGMMNAALVALGRPENPGLWRTHGLKKMVIDIVKNLGNPLLIVDEAQHLDERSIDEIRSWHDETRLGVAFLGNAGLLQTLEGGSRSSARAQLFSRISMKWVQERPLAADIEAMLAAWHLRDEKVGAYVHTIAMKPGGLRGATFAIELAHMIAVAQGEELAVAHVQDAWAQLSMRAIAA